MSANELYEISVGNKKSEKTAEELSLELKHLSYEPSLVALASSQGKLQGYALQRIAALFDSGKTNLPQLRRDFPLLGHQLSIASLSRSQDSLTSLLSEIEDENALIELCENAPASSVRLNLLEKIHSFEALKKLEKSLKHRDKRCLKKIKQKLDVIKKQKATQEEFEKQKARILQELTDHSVRSYNAEYSAKYDSLKRKVENLLPECDAKWQINAAALLDRCKETIVSNQAQQTQPSPPENKDEKSVLPNPDLAIRYCEHLNHILKPGLQPSELFELQKTQEDLAAQCDDFYTAKPDSDALLAELRSLTEAIEAYLFLVKEDAELQSALTRLTDSETTAKTLQDTLRLINRAKANITNNSAFKRFVGLSPLCSAVNEKQKCLAQIEKQEQEKNRHIVGLIRKAHFAVKNGRLKQAQGIRQTISELIDSQVYLPSYIERQWALLVEDISELNDWHAYASTPKLQDLLEEMKKLAHSPETPELQATKIKRLQDEWKSVVKGSGDRHQALWTEFKTAADNAFQVCAMHYKRLDSERQANTEKAHTLIAQLQRYAKEYNWKKASWREVETVIRTAKKSWRECQPLPKLKQQALNMQFELQLKHIQAPLNEAYEKNQSEKSRLVDSLKSLITPENLDHDEKLNGIIQTILKYQKAWKDIGPCRRRDDQILWREFRALCDQAFKKRDENHAQEHAITDQATEKANDIIASLRSIAAQEREDFDQAYLSVNDLRARFKTIAHIPEKRQKLLNHKFRQACADIETQKKKFRQQRERTAWLQLFELKKKLHTALINSDTHATQTIVEQLNNATLPSAGKNALLSILKNTPTQSDESHYRLLCVKAEVFSERASPDEDKALRMRFQVAELQKHFGSTEHDVVALAEEWLSTPPIDEPGYTQLAARFTPRWFTLYETPSS